MTGECPSFFVVLDEARPCVVCGAATAVMVLARVPGVRRRPVVCKRCVQGLGAALRGRGDRRVA